MGVEEICPGCGGYTGVAGEMCPICASVVEQLQMTEKGWKEGVRGQGSAGGERREGENRRAVVASPSRGERAREGEADLLRGVAESLHTACKAREEDGPHWDRLAGRAQADGLAIADVPGDGHCLFHALSRQLASLGVQIPQEDIRAGCCDTLVEHADRLRGTVDGEWDPYVRSMRTGDMGDYTVLRAAAQRYQAVVRVYSSAETWEKHHELGPLEGPALAGRVLRLGHLNFSSRGRQHYVSIQRP